MEHYRKLKAAACTYKDSLIAVVTGGLQEVTTPTQTFISGVLIQTGLCKLVHV